MISTRVTVALLVMALGLGAYIWFFERTSLTAREVDERRTKVLPEFVRDKVERFELDRQGVHLTLKRERAEAGDTGEWNLVMPVRDRADMDTVDALFASLEWAEPRRTLTDVNDRDRKRFGLAEPALRASFVAGGRTVRFAFGREDPQGGGRYMSVGDGGPVHVVPTDVFEALDVDVARFRAKELFREMYVSGADHVTVVPGPNVQTKLELRDGVWWIARATGDVLLANKARVDVLLRALHEARIEKFVIDEPGDLAAYGLQSLAPFLALERSTAVEGKTARLSFGSACPDDEAWVYARVDDGPVVCVQAKLREELSTTADLWESHLVNAADDEVHEIKIARGNRSLELVRADREWSFTAKTPAEARGRAEGDAVEEFLAELRRDSATMDVANDSEVLAHMEVRGAERRVLASLDLLKDSEGLRVRRGHEAELLRFSHSVETLFDPSPLRVRRRRLLEQPDDTAEHLRVTWGETTEELELNGAQWRLKEPAEFDADNTVMRDLLRELGNLHAERFVSEVPLPAHGFDVPRIMIEARFRSPDPARGERVTHRLRIGAATEGGAFGRLDEDPTVFVVGPRLIEVIETPRLSRGLLVTDVQNLIRVEIRSGGDAALLSTAEHLQGLRASEGSAITEPARIREIEEVLGVVRTIRTVGYSVSPREFARPLARVTVSRRAPPPTTYTFEIGRRHGDGASAVYTARRTDIEATFEVRPSVAEAFFLQ